MQDSIASTVAPALNKTTPKTKLLICLKRLLRNIPICQMIVFYYN